jgi:hypothetical protein
MGEGYRVAAMTFKSLFVSAATLLVMTCAGCGSLGFSGGSGKLTSVENGSTLSTAFTTKVYRGSESNVADFYLTDLPESVWKEGGDISHLSGSILHIHMFIAPRAGRTPIATTANSATVRWLVISEGRVGMYGGGGFFNKSGDVGDESLGGTLAGSTMRLIHQGPGFADSLGPAVLSVPIDAKRDETTAEALARAISSLLASSKGE